MALVVSDCARGAQEGSLLNSSFVAVAGVSREILSDLECR